ncbi:unnamed protein product, partial [Arabidopsis halleri]
MSVDGVKTLPDVRIRDYRISGSGSVTTGYPDPVLSSRKIILFLYAFFDFA